jgi:hypothetical protein
MTGAVQTAAPAAPAAGNATLLATGVPDPEPQPTPPPGDPPPKEPGKESEPPKEGEAKGAPPEYGAFTLPEGLTVDEQALTGFKERAKAVNLSQEQAQHLVAYYAELQQQATTAQQAQVQKWADATMADPDLGAKWEQVKPLVAKARDQFASPELRELMETTGLGSHPEVIRLFARIGRSISEDRLVVSGQPHGEDRSADSFYARMAR